MTRDTEPMGYLALVLHAHLPFVRHPELPRFMEEDWLFEAITETYLPLLDVFEGLERDGVPFRVTMSLTPPLVSMLCDPLLRDRYVQYLDERVELASSEMSRLRGSAEFYPLAEMYYELFLRSRARYTDGYGRDLVAAFRRLQDAGFVEIIGCSATHAVLPLHGETTRAAQVRVGVDHYREHFGRGPRGIWLPECAYTPGLEDHLAGHGIRYFLIETTGVADADPRPVYGIHAPVLTQAAVAAFARDVESSHQVWSKDSGYPGDYDYRDFYRDRAFIMTTGTTVEYVVRRFQSHIGRFTKLYEDLLVGLALRSGSTRQHLPARLVRSVPLDGARRSTALSGTCRLMPTASGTRITSRDRRATPPLR